MTAAAASFAYGLVMKMAEFLGEFLLPWLIFGVLLRWTPTWRHLATAFTTYLALRTLVWALATPSNQPADVDTSLATILSLASATGVIYLVRRIAPASWIQPTPDRFPWAYGRSGQSILALALLTSVTISVVLSQNGAHRLVSSPDDTTHQRRPDPDELLRQHIFPIGSNAPLTFDPARYTTSASNHIGLSDQFDMAMQLQPNPSVAPMKGLELGGPFDASASAIAPPEHCRPFLQAQNASIATPPFCFDLRQTSFGPTFGGERTVRVAAISSRSPSDSEQPSLGALVIEFSDLPSMLRAVDAWRTRHAVHGYALVDPSTFQISQYVFSMGQPGQLRPTVIVQPPGVSGLQPPAPILLYVFAGSSTSPQDDT